jgi:hypothetical protein
MSSRHTQILPNRDSRVLRKSEQTDDLAELVAVSDESVVVRAACLCQPPSFARLTVDPSPALDSSRPVFGTAT